MSTEKHKRISRRKFLAGGAALGITAGLGVKEVFSGTVPQAGLTVAAAQDMALINGNIHTMDGTRRVVSQVLIRNGRFAAVGNDAAAQRGNARVIDLKGMTVVPGLIDAHNHIVLVGNRPGWHVLLEDVFTIPDVVKRYQAKAATVPAGQFITTVGPVASMQFPESTFKQPREALEPTLPERHGWRREALRFRPMEPSVAAKRESLLRSSYCGSSF
jgi:hypothetical protein